MGWSLVATDLTGRPLGEIRDCRNRGWRRSLNRGRSGRGTVYPQNSLASAVTAGEKTLVKMYDDRTGVKELRHCGPITGFEKSVDERGSGALTWASSDPSWRLLSRLIGKHQAGASFGTPVALVDRGSVAGQIIDALNRGEFASIWCTKGDTGIRRGPGTDTSIAGVAPPTGLAVASNSAAGGSYQTATTVVYVVTAFNSLGEESLPSAQAQGTTVHSDEGLDVSWAAVAGAVRYRLYRISYDKPPYAGANPQAGYVDVGNVTAVFEPGFGPPWVPSAPGGFKAGAPPSSIAVISGRGQFGPWRYYPAASALGQLFTGLDAPDWDILPMEPTADADGVALGLLLAASVLGSLKPNAVFEFGAGRKNVKTFAIVSDGGTVANDVAHLPSGFPDNATQAVIEVTDAASIADRGLREDALTDEVLTDALRNALVQDHLAVRKVPRRTIQFTLVRDPDPFDTPLEKRTVPRPFVDYDVGDVVPFRATEQCEIRDSQGVVTGYREVKTVDAYFRVFTMDITVNEDDSETVALTFVEEA